MVAKKIPDFPLLSDPDGSEVYGIKDNKDYRIMLGGLADKSDAPIDGKRYIREDGNWIELDSGLLSPARVLVVPDESSRLSLDVYDDLTIAKQSDVGGVFVLSANLDPAIPSNWINLWETVDGVISINGQSGDVYLTYSDVDAAAEVHSHVSTDVTDFGDSVFNAIADTLVAGQNTELEVSNLNKTITIKNQSNDNLLIWQGI